MAKSCLSEISLFLNLDVIGDEIAQKRIIGYIPVIVVIDYNGFYVLSSQEYTKAEGYKEISPVWKQKIPYSHTDGSYVYSFSLDNFLEVYDVSNGDFFSGLQEDLKSDITSEIIQQNDIFQDARRRTIVEAIQREVNYGINQHNQIARQFGITYSFSLPAIDKEEWYKTIDDVGILTFFQGMPIGIGNERYNNYALGAARVIKGHKYYLQTNSLNGITYYHRENCPLLLTKEELMDSRKDAAKAGALPCKECKP